MEGYQSSPSGIILSPLFKGQQKFVLHCLRYS